MYFFLIIIFFSLILYFIDTDRRQHRSEMYANEKDIDTIEEHEGSNVSKRSKLWNNTETTTTTSTPGDVATTTTTTTTISSNK